MKLSRSSVPINADLMFWREESEITSNRKRDSDNGGRFRSSVMSLACVIKMTDRMNDAVSIRIVRWIICCWVPVWTKQNRTRERERKRETETERERERETETQTETQTQREGERE